MVLCPTSAQVSTAAAIMAFGLKRGLQNLDLGLRGDIASCICGPERVMNRSEQETTQLMP